MVTVPRSRVNSFGVPGPRGPTGPTGGTGPTGPTGPSIDPEPEEADEDGIPVVRVSGGETSFDYLKCDDVEFGDNYTPIGRHMAAASNVLPTAIAAALAANPSKSAFRLPAGSHTMTQITEANGLRDNLVFDGLDPMQCELKRTTAGAMFVWNNPVQNLVFRNVTFNIDGVAAPFNSSIAAALGTNVLFDNCRFLCTIPDLTGSGFDDDGIRHQMVFGGGSNITVRNCYFFASQCKLASSEDAFDFDVYNNRFENCNDFGVSICSGDNGAVKLKGLSVRGNRAYGVLTGTGFIYLGSDAATTNPAELSDVQVIDNVCRGTLGKMGSNASRPASRYGIQVVLCDVNKRIKIARNHISNENPAFSTPIVTAIGVYLRNGSSTSTDDLVLDSNSTDFLSDDARGGILIDGPNMTAVGIYRNTIAAGTRGLVVGAVSDSDIENNVVRTSTATGLLLDSTRNAISDVRIRKNKLDAGGSFASAIQFSGSNNMTRIVGEQNRLVTATGSAAVNALTGGATLDYAHNYNSQSAGLSGTITPSSNVGNRTE